MDTEIEETSPILEKAQREYRVWKKNAPYLYDYISTTSLLWPSLTVQFFPDIEQPTPETSYQRLILGTFTLGQSIDAILILRVPMYTQLSSHLDNVDRLNYTDRHEFELNTVPKLKAHPLQKINHLGDVNRVRYMPHNPDIIASLNNAGGLLVYDRTKHPNSNPKDEPNVPQLRLETASSADIFGVDWNKQKESELVAADVEGSLWIYDLREQLKNKDQDLLSPLKLAKHSTGINDIEWSPTHASIFAFVDESGSLHINDTRQPVKDAKKGYAVKTFAVGEDKDALNSLSFGISNYIATGDQSGNLTVVDLRQGPISRWKSFQDSITQVRWHHNHANVLAASSMDTNLKIFDLAKEEKEIFVHSGHMLGVNDFDWSLHDDWLMASVSDDNSLHTWKPVGMEGYKSR